MKTLVRKTNPFNTFPSLLDDFFNLDTSRKNKHYGFLTQPKVNITENNDNFVLDFFVPGIAKEDLTITVNNNILSVSYKHEERKNENDKTVTRKEYKLETFERKFTLSKDIDKENISAKNENGVLSITLQKVKTEEPKLATIEIK